MDEVLRLAESVVANKFTALLLLVIALYYSIRHLIENVKARREGMESRVKFLEEQVLECADSELGLVAVAHKSVALLYATAASGQRVAAKEIINEIDTSLAEIMDRVQARTDSIRARFKQKAVMR